MNNSGNGRGDGSWWYAKALYAIVSGQLAWFLIVITALRGRTEEQWAERAGIGASVSRFVAFMITLGTGSDMQRQVILASRIRHETAAASILAWALAWVSILFVIAAVIRNGDKPKKFTVATVRTLITISALCLVVGVFTPFIEMHARMTVPVIGAVTPKFEEKTISSAVVALFNSGNWIIGLLITAFSIVTPLAKLVVARLALGRISNERRTTIKKVLDTIGKWSMADVFVVAILLACFAIRAADTSTDARPLWGFYFFVTYCLLSMMVSYALGHLEYEPESLPKRVSITPITIAIRSLLSAACFFVSGYFIIYLSLGTRTANAMAASIVDPNPIADSVQHLAAHSTLCIPFSVPHDGVYTASVRVSEGNSLNIFVVSATQIDAVNAGSRFTFIRGSEMLGTRSYVRSLSFVPGPYALVLRDKATKGTQLSDSEVHVRIALRPNPDRK